jgi:hypothetical protein
MLAAFLPLSVGSIVVTVLILRYKLKRKELEMRGGDSVDALRDDVDDTRARLAEMEERLDFAERVLTAGRESQDEKGK